MKKVDFEHFTRFVTPQGVAVRGRDIYFACKHTSLEEGYSCDLYRLREGKVTRLTNLGDSGSFHLTEEGIEFGTLRTAQEKKRAASGVPYSVTYRLPYDGGEAQPCFEIDMAAGGMIPTGDGRFLFTAGSDALYNELLRKNNGDVVKTAADMKEEEDYHICDEVPFYLNGPIYINGKRSRLFLNDNGTYTPLTGEREDCGILWSKGDDLIIAINDFTHSPQPLTNRLYLLNKKTLERTDISFSDSCSHRTAIRLDNGSIFAVVSTAGKYGVEQSPDMVLYENGAWRLLNGDGECSFTTTVNSDITGGARQCGSDVPIRNNEYHFLDTVDDHIALTKVNLTTGKVTRVNNNEMAISTFDFWPDGGYVITALEGNGGTEIYHMDEDGSTQRLTDFNTALCEEYAYSAPEKLSFKNEVGDDVYGWVMKPVNYDPAKKYPAILTMHGGPRTAFGSIYHHESQLWANRGYFVFFCNPTGSDGRGDRFADIRGRYGDIDFRDFMTFTDEVLKKYPAIDEKRLGVTGGSYGGYMTNWMIGHTDRFAAAVSERGISNWVGFYNESDIGYFFADDQTAADPWNNLEKLWKQSPLKYAPAVTTPTLFIQAENDVRCPIAEGIQMFTAVRSRNVDARMVVFKGEQHGLARSSSPKHRIRRMKEILAWFDKYLKPEE